MTTGLLTKAGDARNTATKATEKEKIQVEVMGAYDNRGKLIASKVEDNISKNIKDATVTATTKEGIEEKFFPVKVEYNNGHKYQVDENGQIMMSVNAGDKAPSDSNAVYSSGDYTAIIPAGFTVSATESSIENGLVVTDGSSNEWVWIPVSNEDFSAMFGTATDDGWTMDGTDVKTKYKSNGGIINPITRVTPGDTSSYREPDVLNKDNYDKETTNLSAAGLGATLSEMATKLRDDYKNMIDSVRKNGGFYVGRYELSEAGIKKDQPSLTNTDWYDLYAKCKTFGDESTTYSRMIWGCQWDQVCKFISTAKDKNGQTISLSDSTSYGNYWNSENSPQNKINTGSNDNCKTNNIYDLAGNCYEWTQEAFRTNNRAYRGGDCRSNGDNDPVTGRNGWYPTYANFSISSRPVLYLK